MWQNEPRKQQWHNFQNVVRLTERQQKHVSAELVTTTVVFGEKKKTTHPRSFETFHLEHLVVQVWLHILLNTRRPWYYFSFAATLPGTNRQMSKVFRMYSFKTVFKKISQTRSNFMPKKFMQYKLIKTITTSCIDHVFFKDSMNCIR